jgi:hypothetical protein
MYRKHHNGQLSIEDFHAPFGGTLDSDNRWVILSSLMPWEELEETYAPQFNPTTGAPAKPVRLAFGALFIKQRLSLADVETVEQIRENAYMQFFLGFAGYSSKAPRSMDWPVSHGCLWRERCPPFLPPPRQDPTAAPPVSTAMA